MISIKWPEPSRVEGPEFKQFSRLPLEPRLLVWKFALPGPRVLKLGLADSGIFEDHVYTLAHGGNFLDKRLLLTSKETHQMFLKKHHQIVLQGTGEPLFIPDHCETYVI